MASVSPPKPWERAGAGAGAASSTMATTTPTAANPASTATTTSSTPALPSRPDSLNTVVNRTASSYSPYGASRLGASPYGTMGGYSSYSSPYSRFGGMGSMYGGMGGMYGGYGGMYGGMGGMGGMDPNDPNSLTQSFSQSTQATFQMIESIVGAFGGFAQMLESTYMATHSSFYAMVSVAEQFGNLRTTLGSVLGIFTIMRWVRTLFAKLTGRPPPADATALTPAAFAAFSSGAAAGSRDANGQPKPSRKPFIMFIVAVFGLPYLMGKLIRALARSQEEEAKRNASMDNSLMIGPDGQPQPLDPSKLDFCRVMYDYTPDESQAAGTPGIDLAVKKGDLVAVLSKTDPMGNASEWWRCRARDGNVGYLPAPYLETIQRRQAQIQAAPAVAASAAGSRTMSLNSMQAEKLKNANAQGTGKGEVPVPAGQNGVESFQKGAFYS